MVVFHDFLDHLDGIVAKVHKRTYPNHDDPLLGGFLDAFCDKIVNIFSLWSIIQMTPIDNFNNLKLIIIIVCYSVIGYETIIGIVRVEDFYEAKFNRYIH
jgi:phosphatidylglycerophosphate synthase